VLRGFGTAFLASKELLGFELEVENEWLRFVERRRRPLLLLCEEMSLARRDKGRCCGVDVVGSEGGGGLVSLLRFFPNFFLGSEDDEVIGVAEFMNRGVVWWSHHTASESTRL